MSLDTCRPQVGIRHERMGPDNSELRKKIGRIHSRASLKGDDTIIHAKQTSDTVTADFRAFHSRPRQMSFEVDGGG